MGAHSEEHGTGLDRGRAWACPGSPWSCGGDGALVQAASRSSREQSEAGQRLDEPRHPSNGVPWMHRARRQGCRGDADIDEGEPGDRRPAATIDAVSQHQRSTHAHECSRGCVAGQGSDDAGQLDAEAESEDRQADSRRPSNARAQPSGGYERQPDEQDRGAGGLRLQSAGQCRCCATDQDQRGPCSLLPAATAHGSWIRWESGVRPWPGWLHAVPRRIAGHRSVRPTHDPSRPVRSAVTAVIAGALR